MKLKPLYTEKTMALSKLGKYTFLVDRKMTKTDIKKVINQIFGVDIVEIKTINSKRMESRSVYGKKKVKKAFKKAVFTLKKDQKIDLFEETKKPEVKKAKKKGDKNQ